MTRRTDLPKMAGCTGCGECCTVVRARPDEIKRIRQLMREKGVTWEVNDGLRCGFLRDGPVAMSCAVYEARPWACRAFGVIAEMPCKYAPDDVQTSIPPADAERRRLTDVDDKLLGEVFEPGYADKLAAIVWAEERAGAPPAGTGARLIEAQRRQRIPVYLPVEGIQMGDVVYMPQPVRPQ